MFEALVWARLASQVAAVKIASGASRAAERLTREQRGQDLIEYGGILILVAAIIAAMFQLGIISDVKNFVSSAVNNIIGSGAASKVSQSGS
jgi:Flp pilus assembly pilin Flp